MSDPLAGQLEALSQEQREKDAAAQTKAEEEAFYAASEAFTRLDNLMHNEDMLWFIATYLAPVRDKADERTKIPSEAAKHGPIAAHEYQIAKTLAEMLKDEHAKAQAVLDPYLREKGLL